MSSFINDVASLTVADWFRLVGLLGILAVTYALGMEAGREKAVRNGGVGWFGYAFIAFWAAVYTIAHGHVGSWWASIPGYGD
jgi:hypothetical protein